MSLTSLLLLLIIMLVVGVTVGIIRKNKLVLIIFSLLCAVIISFILFLIFILIPSM